jgi:hypothetical protein
MMTEKRTRQDLNNSVKLDSLTGSRQDLKTSGKSFTQDQIGKSINVFNDTPGVENPFLSNNPFSQAGQSSAAAIQNASQSQSPVQSESPNTLQGGTKTSEK